MSIEIVGNSWLTESLAEDDSDIWLEHVVDCKLVKKFTLSNVSAQWQKIAFPSHLQDCHIFIENRSSVSVNN